MLIQNSANSLQLFFNSLNINH